jgi:MFS transporter, PAT family, beta-lactamase induction signal transducer AmpG
MNISKLTTAKSVSQKNTRFPALAEHSLLRYFAFVALYFAQGLTWGILLLAIPAWFAINGKSPGEIAGFAVAVTLPPSFKFIVAPLMDRYTYLPMGRKRPWILLAQLTLIASCIFMAYVPAPLNNLNRLIMCGFMVSCSASIFDVAIDGMAVDIIPIDQQARTNGLMWGSLIIAMSAALAAGTWLINNYDYSTAMLTLAVVVSIFMLVPLLLKERQGEKILPWTAGKALPETKKLQLSNWRSILKALYSVFSLRNSLLLAVVFFTAQGASQFMETLVPIFTIKQLGWNNSDYAQYYSTASLIGGISGMLVGGILIDKFGKKKMMNIYFFSLIIFTILFAFSKTYWSNKNFIYGYMMAFNVLSTFITVGLYAIAMECCWKKVSASQFTFYMAVGNLGRMVFTALIEPLQANFSWEITLFTCAILLAIALLLLQFLNIERQVERVAALEKKAVENEGMLVISTEI